MAAPEKNVFFVIVRHTLLGEGKKKKRKKNKKKEGKKCT